MFIRVTSDLEVKAKNLTGWFNYVPVVIMYVSVNYVIIICTVSCLPSVLVFIIELL